MPVSPLNADAAPTPSSDLERLVAALRASVATYVAGRRDRGVAMERVIPEVRRLVRDVEDAEGAPDALGVLDGQVMRWTIEAYLDEPALQHVPRFY